MLKHDIHCSVYIFQGINNSKIGISALVLYLSWYLFLITITDTL